MANTTERQRKIARKTAESLADHNTPFIRNAWYVIAKADEVSREPIARRVHDTSIVLYRTTDGSPKAFQDRCCHRSFPLSASKVEGDNIRCGYHGLLYDSSGKCIEVPMQDKAPANIRLKAYAVIEKGAFIWVWMGNQDEADESTLPHQEWMDHPEWDMYIGYLHVNGSYVHMHENLLDLSHLSFLHETTFGTPEYAKAPIEATIDGDHIEVWRRVECELPPIYAKPLGWEGMKVLRSSGSRYVSPGLHINTGILKNLELSIEQQNPIPTVKVAQLLTPESRHSTHYWFALARNFALNDKRIDEFMLSQQTAAFSEDAFAIESIARFQQSDADPEFYEIHIPTDKTGVAMRRHLKSLADTSSQEE